MRISKTLTDNYKCLEGSFIFYLHEMSEFNEVAFWEYYNSVVELTILTKESNTIDREILDMVCYTHNYILISFMWHFSPEDGYFISKLPNDNFNLYIERLEGAFNGFIKGQIYDDDIFELRNPMSNDK